MAADPGSARRFAVPAPGKAALATLLVLLSGLPVLVYLMLVDGFRTSDPGARIAVFAAAAIVTLVAIGILVAAQRRSVMLEHGVLIVRATLYTQRIPLGELLLDQARIVDLREHTELRPRLKLNGFALPGFHAGHFRAAMFGPGRHQRLFCLVTDPSRVLALPERSGRTLLLSQERPQALLEALRR